MGFEQDFTLASIELKDKKVIRDVIHDYIHIDHTLIWHLINTKEMQRLRRIKQLGGTYQVFQCAEHSRFVHSMGVYQVVLRMLELDCLKTYLSDYDQLCVMCAALLHDIGHGPFSHSFEGIFTNNHEEMTIYLITHESDVYHLLSQFYEKMPYDVASIIDHTHPNRVLIQMISSQLDADRMDYLLRDSYMCGTTYGHFDMSRILRTMRVHNGRIVYKYSGVHAIENYILARYHMYWQVYFHPTTRSYEHLLQTILKRVQDLYDNHFEFKCDMVYLKPFLKGCVQAGDFTALDESVMLYYFKEFVKEKDDILSDLSKRILNRHLFKYRQYHPDHLNYIIQKTKEKGYDPRYYVFSDLQQQIPYLHYGRSGELNEIEILHNNGQIMTLPDASEIVASIISSKQYKSDHKIFYIKEIKDVLSNEF